MTKGRSIRLFLADGTPGGIITAEIMNWTGHVMTAPRSRLADLIQRPEAGRTGIYILSGTDPDGGYKPLVYLGETDSVGKRLAQHNKDGAKEFWEQTCIVTSKDQNLTKAHARYLESRLIQISAEAGRAKLVNSTAPDAPQLPEADLSDMEFFIEQLRVVLPVLGLEFLKEAAKIRVVGSDDNQIGEVGSGELIFEANVKKISLHAEARQIDGDFVVLAGSQARAEWGGVHDAYQNLYDRLVADNVLVMAEDGNRRFASDFAFRSPSAAAAVVTGRTANGRNEWRIKGTTTTYAQWQDAQVAAVTVDGGEE